MTIIDESALVGKTRDQPINDRLRGVLLAAGDEAGIDVIRVISGGQPGSSGRSQGSHRHDDGNAADLELLQNGRALDFTVPKELDVISQFVTAAAAHGATGIGAGVNYMGPKRLHVGFGNGPRDNRQTVWGDGEASANAPAWLREAAGRGWHISVGGPIMTTNRSESVFVSKAPGVMRALMDKFSLTDTQAAGVLGNIGHECAGFTILREIGQPEGRGGYGWCQWTGPRRQTFLSWCNAQGLDWRSDEANLGYLIHELSGSQNASIVRLRRTRSLEEAVEVFEKAFEGAGVPAMGPRNHWARVALDAFHRLGPVAPPEIPSPGPMPADLWVLLTDLLRRLQLGEISAIPGDSNLPSLKLGDSGDEVKRLQELLNGLKYFTGGADGSFGKLTRSAIALFQLDNGLPATGVAGKDTWAALVNGSTRPLPDQRGGLTPDDLRKLGSKTVQNADWVRYLGWFTGALGLGGLGKGGACSLTSGSLSGCPAPTIPTPTVPTADSLLETLQLLQKAPELISDPNFKHALESLQLVLQKAATLAPAAKAANQAAATTLPGIVDTVLPWLTGLLPGTSGSLLAMGLGVAFHVLGSNIIQRRVQDQRDGKNIGPRTVSDA
jgi:peptidoglycan hydrolase-like protein with peptidoglycan-binding domain